jgi:gluconolactonase
MKTFRVAGWLVAAGLVSPVHADSFKVLNDDVHFAEGPVWYQGKLYYVEYDRNTVTVWDGKSNHIFASQKGCGQSAVVPTVRGEFLTTCYDNGTIGRMAADGSQLPPYDHDREGNKFLGPNDFAPDSHDGIYFTASGSQGPVFDAKVFYIARDGTITLAAADLHRANGLAVSRDGKTLYVVETDENRLLRFNIDSPGRLSERRIFLNLDELTHHVGHIWPDGVKIDSHDRIYIGQNPRDPHAPLAGTIFVLDAQGKLLKKISVPSPGVPNLAFSPDEKTLYITALDQLDKPPFRGKIYAVPLE